MLEELQSNEIDSANESPEVVGEVAEEVAKSIFQVDIGFENNERYLEEIRKFRELCTEGRADLAQSDGGFNIEDVSVKQLEMNIFADRITFILQRTLDKIKLIGYVPHFLSNGGEIMRKYTSTKESDAFISKLTAPPINTVRAKSKSFLKKFRTIVDGFFDPELAQIVESLQTNKCLSLYSKKVNLPLEPLIKDLISTFKKLLKIISKKLRRTAEEERNREKMLKVNLRDYKERKAAIERLVEKLRLQEEETNERIKAKEKVIEKYKEKIGNMRTMFKSKVENLVAESEKEMVQLVEASEELQVQISVEAQEAELNAQSLLEEHLAEERILRTKRSKVESQLASCIAKFDQDIGFRQEQADTLEEEYDLEREQLAELECLVIEQDKVYSKYKVMKDTEDEAIFAGILYKFMAERAAKLIQRSWRAYRARKLARRKGKKGKGKGKKK